MNIYIYDSFVNEKKYASSIARIETRITDLGLNGKIVRLGIVTSVFDTIESELKKGAKSIVVVGNNQILNQAVNAMAAQFTINPFYKNIPLGIIPFGDKNNEIAEYLGCRSGDDSCSILSARRIQRLDLVKANSFYFLTQAMIEAKNTKLEIDNHYTIECSEPGNIGIINFPVMPKILPQTKSSAKDGLLELFIKTGKSKKYLKRNAEQDDYTVLSFKKLRVINPGEGLVIDKTVKIPAPIDVSISNLKINLIVGKNRQF